MYLFVDYFLQIINCVIWQMISNKMGYPLAVMSGFCAACTSLYSKLLSEGYLLTKLLACFPDANKNFLVVLSYGGAVVLNVIMWLAFVTALGIGQKGVAVLATNTLSNFAFSVSHYKLVSRNCTGSFWQVYFPRRTDCELVCWDALPEHWNNFFDSWIVTCCPVRRLFIDDTLCLRIEVQENFVVKIVFSVLLITISLSMAAHFDY